MDKVRLRHTDSVNAIDTNNRFDVSLKTSYGKIKYNSIRATVDHYEQFLIERMNSNKYRLIVTLNPFCTNVLFNPLTEITVYGEGNEKRLSFRSSNTVDGIDDDGQNKTSERVQRIANTKLGGNSIKCEYFPGYDIFDNHILRGKTFKLVNGTENNKNKAYFNTLADYMRDRDGKNVRFFKRTSLTSTPKKTDKHLYDYDEVMSFVDTVNDKLIEDNGWFGFSNEANIETDTTGGRNRIINDNKSCEFICMCPDKSLFSFVPYYNEKKDRMEENWKVFLTYPYKNAFNEIVLDNDNSINALMAMSVRLTQWSSGDDIILFRCVVKHNLKKGEEVAIYYKIKQDGEYYGKTYMVDGVGDIEGKNDEYYFYIGDMSILDDIKEYANLEEDSDIGEWISDRGNIEFRIRRVVGGVPSVYYLRKFKVIPNLKYAKRKPTEEEMYDASKYDEYLKENAVYVAEDGKKFYYTFDCENYKLAFANTIYADECAQYTYTDDVDLTNLKDNFGRPLSEIFFTVLKTNKGYDEWYGNGGDYERSRVFAEVTSGLEISHDIYDSEAENKLRSECFDIRKIHNLIVSNGVSSVETKQINSLDNTGEPSGYTSITPEYLTDVNQDGFCGDIIEYCPTECAEYVLSDVMYRFNTYQRDYIQEDKIKFVYHEITFDDYDANDFKLDKVVSDCSPRFEGYMYKPHYRIKIKELSDVRQAAHFNIAIKNVKPVIGTTVKLNVTSKLSGMAIIGSIVFLCDDKNHKKFIFVITETLGKTNFNISPYGGWERIREDSEDIYETPLNWQSITKYLNNGTMVIRGRNSEIPDYAKPIGANTYLWRDVVNSDPDSDDETSKITFANGSFYLTPTINFYVKRQDSDGDSGLYADVQFPNDVSNVVNEEAVNNEFVEPEDMLC